MSDAAWLYENLIRGFCEAAGIADWKTVHESQHVAMGERLVGIIPLSRGGTPMISVCIELGQTYPDRDGEVYARLLAANLEGPRMRGHYAVHHESKQATYCMWFPLDAIEGAELAAIVLAELQTRRMPAAAVAA